MLLMCVIICSSLVIFLIVWDNNLYPGQAFAMDPFRAISKNKSAISINQKVFKKK